MKKILLKLMFCVVLLSFNTTIVNASEACEVHSDSLCGYNNYKDNYVEKESTMNINGKEIKWSYKLKGEEAFALECLNSEDLIGDVYIPGEIDGYKVISIMSINGANNMTSLSFHENIESVGYIESITLTKLNLVGINSIGRVNFFGDSYGNNLKEIILSKEGLKPGTAAYYLSYGLDDIVIIYEDGTEIVNSIWEFNTKATVIIPNTVKVIENLMDLAIREFVIPSSVKKFKYDLDVGIHFKSSKGFKKLTVYSMDIEYENVEFSEDLVIYCYEGSTTEKYAKENGIKYEYIKDEEKFLSNSKEQTILEKTSYKVRVNSDLDNFKDIVFIDGKLVDSKNYTVKSGSTIIEFSKEFISTLSNGSHKVDMAFNEGYVSTTFKITNNPEEVNVMKEETLTEKEETKEEAKTEKVEENIVNPETGEQIYKIIALFVMIILSSVVILKKAINIVKNSSY